jgi:hypothetical protein
MTLRSWWRRIREACVICGGSGIMKIIDADIWPLMLTRRASRCPLCRGRGWYMVWPWRKR